MAALAKGLPVCFVPEQPLVTPVRNNMIHHGGGGKLAFPPAFRAQRMPLQKSFSFLPPSGVIAPGVRAAAHAIRAPHDMIPAEHLTRQTKTRTARIPAGSRRYSRHIALLYQSSVSMSRTS